MRRNELLAEFMKKVVFFSLLTILFMGCDSKSLVGENIDSVKKYFPIKIGNTWEYSFNNGSEFAVLERVIKNNITHEDGSNIWGYTEAVKIANPNPDEPVVGYFTFKSDGLYYYSSAKDTMFTGTNILCRKELLLKDPIKVGTQWEANAGGLSEIMSISDVQVLEKNYPGAVLVVTKLNNNIDSSWYALNIGLVKNVKYYLSSEETSSSVTWELRNYVF